MSLFCATLQNQKVIKCKNPEGIRTIWKTTKNLIPIRLFQHSDRTSISVFSECCGSRFCWSVHSPHSRPSICGASYFLLELSRIRSFTSSLTFLPKCTDIVSPARLYGRVSPVCFSLHYSPQFTAMCQVLVLNTTR